MYGCRIGRVEQQITAVSLDRDDAARLDEATESIHPGDRFAYTMNLRRGA